MFIHPDQWAPIARLLQFLRDGEYLASHCARAQAQLALDPGMRRFLRSQARQESYHAIVFQANIAWLAPRHLGGCPLLPPLARYRTLIEDAIRRGDFAETLMGEQIILEGLGEAILERIEEGLAKRTPPSSAFGACYYNKKKRTAAGAARWNGCLRAGSPHRKPSGTVDRNISH
jgi:hypothetical protein